MCIRDSEEGRGALHAEGVALLLVLLDGRLGGGAVHVRTELVEVLDSGRAGEVDELVLGERVALAEFGEELVVERCEAALLPGGPGGAGGPLGVLAEDREVAELDAQDARVDVLLDQFGLGLAGEAAAVGALVVGVLHEHDGRVRLAESEPVVGLPAAGGLLELVVGGLLRVEGRLRAGGRGGPALAGAARALADGDAGGDQRHDEGRYRADGRQAAGGCGQACGGCGHEKGTPGGLRNLGMPEHGPARAVAGRSRSAGRGAGRCRGRPGRAVPAPRRPAGSPSAAGPCGHRPGR